jgi:hypothetical protein
MLIRSLVTRIKEGVPYTVGFVLASFSAQSSAGEFHPHALTEPDVNLSIHPALIVQPLETAFPYSLIPPIPG